MKDRPILFSAPMVRAILAGTKTQTRRVLPTMTTLGRVEYPGRRDRKGYSHVNWLDTPDGIAAAVRECRHGQPGDRLWVRETFFAWGRWETRYSAKKGRDEWHFVDMTLECGKAYEYPATGGQPQPMGGARHRVRKTPTWWKRPAIHMPRAASRITLQITSVRVERLQEISEADALAEGISSVRSQSWDRQQFPEWRFLFDAAVQAGTKPPLGPSPAEAFEKLWVSINGDASWDANPWVWAITFNRIESTT